MKDGSRSFINFKPEKKNQEDDCFSIVFDAGLDKPQLALLESKEGDILSVHLEEDNLIVYKNDILCGYITSLDAIKVRKCIQKGSIFKAVILKINKEPLSCIVKIRIYEK